MIDLVYKTLLTIINKENQGYISPTEFNLLANNVQNEIFRNYFEDENRDKNNDNRGLVNKGYSNLDFNERQRINQFSEIVVIDQNGLGNFDLPSDLYFIEDDGVYPVTDTNGNISQSGNIIEEVERNNIGYLSRSLSSPSALYPIYERYSSYIVVYPSSVTKLQMRYLREPKQPNWTYTIINNTELFDPSNNSFQDFELHESEFSNIVNRMLTYFSINIREMEIVQIAEMLKDKMTLKDN